MFKPLTIAVTVATAGTRVAVTSGSVPAAFVYFEELSSSTGNVFIGNNTVTSTNYMARLTPGQGFRLDAPNNVRPGNEIDLKNISIDAQTAGAVVFVSYLTRMGNV